MKRRVLLDTNMMAYILDNHILDEKISQLTKLLYDSDEYIIVIHPDTLKEAQKIKDKNKRDIFISKLSVYDVIENPPKMPDNFNQLAGCNNENDKIDNELLYSVVSKCASFFITNDKKLLNKAKKLGLEDKALSIDEAINKFNKDKIVINTPAFIRKEHLYNINLKDSFFDSLRKDYLGFDDWFNRKKEYSENIAYISKRDGRITSFLMLKEEDENEDYSDFEKPFKKGKRLKISTFKVEETGKKIGECFIKITINEAMQKNVDEIYVTTFPKQNALRYLLEQYGFKFYTYKNSKNKENTQEMVYVKNMKDKSTYPFVQIKNQNIFIFPVRPEYHKLLFEEAEDNYQISIRDTQGMNTSANAIRKAFISNAKIKEINKGDILLFYESHEKKAITTLGIVETNWNKFNSIEEIANIVKKRTAYNNAELKEVCKLDSLVIMFKHYVTFKNSIDFNFLYNNRIVNGYIQRPLKIRKEDLMKIIEVSGSQAQFEIISEN